MKCGSSPQLHNRKEKKMLFFLLIAAALAQVPFEEEIALSSEAESDLSSLSNILLGELQDVEAEVSNSPEDELLDSMEDELSDSMEAFGVEDGLLVSMEDELSGKRCKPCDCWKWDGKNYSQCYARKCRMYCVQCQNDGVTPMKGSWRTHQQQCIEYARPPGILSPFDKGVCWKNTYGRGVGKIPSGCSGDYKQHGLLCYKNCPNGYRTVTGHVDPYCYRTCRRGYHDHGLTCYKHFFDWYFKTDKIGRIRGMSCGSGMENDAGLCYKRCSSGTHGVGPVCWGKCKGDKPVNGGAICCKDRNTCTKKIIDLTTSVLKTVLKGASKDYAGAGVQAAKTVLGYIMPICGK